MFILSIASNLTPDAIFTRYGIFIFACGFAAFAMAGFSSKVL